MSKKVRSGYDQLCWRCENACNENKCIWVDTLSKTYPDTKIDEKNNIIKCPNFIHDKFFYTKKEIADYLGITLVKYHSTKNYLKKHNKPYDILSIKEYLEEREKLKQLTPEEKDELRKKRRRETEIKHYLKRHNRNISVEEYLKEREEFKKLTPEEKMQRYRVKEKLKNLKKNK